jgi:hypothetical protein
MKRDVAQVPQERGARPKLTVAQRRLLEQAARHSAGRVIGNEAWSCTMLVKHGLIKPDGFNRVGPLFKITAAGRKAIAKASKGEPAVRHKPRVALAFKACKDGALIIYADLPAIEHWWEGEPIRIEPRRVCEVLAACGDALAKKSSVR